MNWLRKILIVSACAGVASCGVKGDPLPPEKPPTLGRGRPTYKRATEEIQIQKRRPPPDTNKDKASDDDEKE
jgi:hypothetical protein